MFHEAVEEFDPYEDLEESVHRYERAAAKGHEESIWICSVLKDVEMEMNALKEAFAKTEEPLGWYVAGQLSEWFLREQFDFFKKSAEGGCSWGQVEYGQDFRRGGDFVEEDKKVHLEWLEKSAKQNNPRAMDRLGSWFREEGGDKEKAVSYYRAAAELGWKASMRLLSVGLRDGEGCEKDLIQAVVWSAKGDSISFGSTLRHARVALQSETIENLGCDFDQLCYSLAWGLYWYKYGTEEWNERHDSEKVFSNRCLDYYCSCVELQQKSICTFLLCWNRTVGVYDAGFLIAQMVWEERAKNMLKLFEKENRQEHQDPEMKRIKK
jgi:TPR repeat protein